MTNAMALMLYYTQWIILGSPPCQFWSQANTVGDKGPEAAELARALVSILRLFYEVLEAVFMVRLVCFHGVPCTNTDLLVHGILSWLTRAFPYLMSL